MQLKRKWCQLKLLLLKGLECNFALSMMFVLMKMTASKTGTKYLFVFKIHALTKLVWPTKPHWRAVSILGSVSQHWKGQLPCPVVSLTEGSGWGEQSLLCEQSTAVLWALGTSGSHSPVWPSHPCCCWRGSPKSH